MRKMRNWSAIVQKHANTDFHWHINTSPIGGPGARCKISNKLPILWIIIIINRYDALSRTRSYFYFFSSKILKSLSIPISAARRLIRCYLIIFALIKRMFVCWSVCFLSIVIKFLFNLSILLNCCCHFNGIQANVPERERDKERKRTLQKYLGWNFSFFCYRCYCYYILHISSVIECKM